MIDRSPIFPLFRYLYSKMWENNHREIIEKSLFCHSFIENHRVINLFMIAFIKAFQNLRNSFTLSEIYLYWSQFFCSIFFENKGYIRSRFFPVKIDGMSIFEFSLEFKKYKIFENSFFCLTVVISVSESALHKRKVSKIQFGMTSHFCIWVCIKWPNCPNHSMFCKDRGVFSDLSTSNSYHLSYPFFFKKLSDVHGNSTNKFYKFIFLLWKDILFHFLKLLSIKVSKIFSFDEIFSKGSEVNIHISKFFESIEMNFSRHNLCNIDRMMISFSKFSKSNKGYFIEHNIFFFLSNRRNLCIGNIDNPNFGHL